MGVCPVRPRALLIVGGAGGVGSIAVQLARVLTDITVIATASRPETIEWVRSLGAHLVVDHSASPARGRGAVAQCATGSRVLHDEHLCAPRRHRGMDRAAAPLCVVRRPSGAGRQSPHAQKRLDASEFVFMRSLFGTADIGAQGQLLAFSGVNRSRSPLRRAEHVPS